jgi:hypothetical protein
VQHSRVVLHFQELRTNLDRGSSADVRRSGKKLAEGIAQR